jgi:divalent metal cation (Fe/Co/Zn/Cd) transporter
MSSLAPRGTYWTQEGQDLSWSGLAVSIAAIPTMYWLSRQQLKVAERLGSRALRADAVESITCGWLALVVVVGLAVEWLTGVWWVDAATSLVIVYFLVKEGREAWEGEECCDDD